MHRFRVRFDKCIHCLICFGGFSVIWSAHSHIIDTEIDVVKRILWVVQMRGKIWALHIQMDLSIEGTHNVFDWSRILYDWFFDICACQSVIPRLHRTLAVLGNKKLNVDWVRVERARNTTSFWDTGLLVHETRGRVRVTASSRSVIVWISISKLTMNKRSWYSSSLPIARGLWSTNLSLMWAVKFGEHHLQADESSKHLDGARRYGTSA